MSNRDCVVSRWKAARLIADIPNGQAFRITFVKRTTGELREMTCQKGVSAHVTGKGPAYDPQDHNLLVVWDMVKRAYRSVPYEGLRSLKTGGKEYTVA